MVKYQILMTAELLLSVFAPNQKEDDDDKDEDDGDAYEDCENLKRVWYAN